MHAEPIASDRIVEESHVPLGRVQLAIGMIAQAGLKTCTSREEIVELLANAKSPTPASEQAVRHFRRLPNETT